MKVNAGGREEGSVKHEWYNFKDVSSWNPLSTETVPSRESDSSSIGDHPMKEKMC